MSNLRFAIALTALILAVGVWDTANTELAAKHEQDLQREWERQQAKERNKPQITVVTLPATTTTTTTTTTTVPATTTTTLPQVEIDPCAEWSEECTRQLVRKHGLPDMFVRIAGRESRHDPRAKSPTKDFGLFQINRAAWEKRLKEMGWITEMEDLFDPDLNARVAVLIFNGGKGNGFGHWAVCEEASWGYGTLDCDPNR